MIYNNIIKIDKRLIQHWETSKTLFLPIEYSLKHAICTDWTVYNIIYAYNTLTLCKHMHKQMKSLYRVVLIYRIVFATVKKFGL